MLSARGEEYDRIHGFEIGVDDYVVKPFSPKELMMRVQAILKRSQTASPDNGKEILTFEGLTVDFTGRIVTIDGVKGGSFPKRVRPPFLSGAEPEYCFVPRDPDQQRLGL